MTDPNIVPLDMSRLGSEEAAIHLAQRLADAPRPDTLREDVAAHCDDAARLGVLHALLLADADPEDRLRARIARRREAMLALDHAELHFTILSRRAEDVHARQLADALRHASKSTRSQLGQEIDDLTRRHADDRSLCTAVSGMTRKLG